MIRYDQFEVISIDVSPYEICVLPYGNFISTNSEALTIFDDNFKQIKKLEIQVGHIFGCTLNHRNEIYVSNHHTHVIHMMDLNLNIIKTFGSKGSHNDQFQFPISMCCRNEFLYVCDSANKRIQKFDLDFQYIDTIKLNFRPYSIKVSDENDMCLISGPNGVSFVDLKLKILRHHYSNVFGRISYANSNFFVVSNHPTKRAFCYDVNGILLEEIDLDRLSEFIKCDWDGFILCSKNELYISSNDGKKILKFI